MLGALIAFLPVYYLMRPFTAHNPTPRWFMHTITSILGISVKTKGQLPEGNCFLLANHISWLDILALGGATGSAFVAHDGLAQIKPLRWICSLNDTVFIARHDKRSIAKQVQDIRTALDETGRVTLFPEGTTTDLRKPEAFKSSLLSIFQGDFGTTPTHAVPVWLDYGNDINTVAWVGEETGLQNALRILGKVRPCSIIIHYLPPLTAEETADRKQMAQAALEAIKTVPIH